MLIVIVIVRSQVIVIVIN